MSGSARGVGLLALGACAGIVLAASGILTPPATSSVGGDVIARVNGQPILRADYERLLNGLSSDRREPLDRLRQQQILDRLIEEELLLQRAMALNLPRNDIKTRNDLVQAMIGTVVTEADTHEPTDDDITKFFEANRGVFRRPDRVRVRQIFCRVRDGSDAADAERRCAEASTRWQAGEDFVDLARSLGDPVSPPLPDVFLPATKLTEYLGPTAAQTVQALLPGGISLPLRTAAGLRVVQLVERQADADRGIDDLRDQVRAEMRRRAGDDALRRYLQQLREQAQIVTAVHDAPPTAP